jgi:hypothetical protein
VGFDACWNRWFPQLRYITFPHKTIQSHYNWDIVLLARA